MGSHSLLQGIFPTQGSIPSLLHCRWLLYYLSHPGSPLCLSAAAAAKSLQSCPTLCDAIDGSPPGSPVPGILQERTLEWVAISFSSAWKVKSGSEVAQSCLTLSDPMDCSLPGSSIHGIFQSRVRWVQLCGSLNILWHCLSLGLEWKLTFSSPVATAESSKFAGMLRAAQCILRLWFVIQRNGIYHNYHFGFSAWLL